MKLSFRIRLLAAVCLVGALFGCSSARMTDFGVDNAFRAHRYDEAADKLKKGYQEQGEKGRDSLLYVLDLGLALHSGGKYDESTKYFLQANDLSVIKDYTSISKEAATLLVSDNIKDYKVEDFENVLINTYLAMNYAAIGNFDDALVEARRTNQKLYMMVSQGGRKYKQSAFTRYLSAMLYEANGDYDDAYIDYKNTLGLAPEYPGLGKDLWRCAVVLGFDDDKEKWDDQFHLTAEDHKQAMLVAPKSPKGEIIVLYENGISPVKRPNPQFKEVPKFYPRYNPVAFADVEVNGKVLGETHMLDNIETVAIENLEEKWGGMVAKKVAGLLVKGAAAYGVAKLTGSPLLGELAGMALVDADQADCRSWNLLPHDLQVARIPVDAGTYTVKILPRGPGAPPAPEKTIQVTRGKRVFVNFRYMP
jgi:hypothetical protein